MRPNQFLRTTLAHPQFEILEDRLVMSAQPAADFWLDDQVTQQPTQQIMPTLDGAHEVTGLEETRDDYGFDGSGQTVVVIDSGIAWDHVDLGGGFGADYRVVGGWDFTEENDADPYDDGPAGAHGTHVAGIIGSSHDVHSGVASGVDLISLRVFNDAGEGRFAWVEEALQWVHDHRDDFANPITTVNLSLGANWNADSIPNWAVLEEEFAQLEQDGIFISVAAGNDFTTYNDTGLTYPAASPYVVPVASVDDSGALSYFSQRNDRVIAAPGRGITSTVPDYVGNFNGRTDDYLAFSGTSMAAPYVAGASVLIRQAFAFVGEFDVTQDQIYDVMRESADLFHDPVTNATYHRLNIQAALDLIMPADDYGSTLATAHELGRLVEADPLVFSGLFNTLQDDDYFQFVADASGLMTISASSDDNRAFAAQLVGDVSQQWNGGEFSFEVVAGQTYGVRFSAGGELGHYETRFELQAAEEVVPIDLGDIDWQELADEEIHGGNWYRVTATRTGWMTAQVDAGENNSTVTVAFHDEAGNLLGFRGTGQGTARADQFVQAGEQVLIRVTAPQAADLLLANVVALDGDAATLHGTTSTDQFEVHVGADQIVSINGLSYQIVGDLLRSLRVEGGEGADQLLLTGSAADESLTISTSSLTFASDAIKVTGDGVEFVAFDGAGGHDTALLFGTAGNDQFFSHQDRAWLLGDDYRHDLTQVEQIAVAASAGYDRGYLYDSPGLDVFNGQSDRATLERGDEVVTIHQFDRVYAYSTQGGGDKAFLYDSPADDTYRNGPGYASFLGDGYQFDVVGYATTKAYSIHGGSDVAVFAGSAGNDQFAATEAWAYMRIDGFYNAASGFTNISVFGNGGVDQADLMGSFGDDQLTVHQSRVTLTAASYRVMLKDFEQVAVTGGFGGFDQAVFQDAYYDEVVYVSPQSVSVTRGALSVSVEDFDGFTGLPVAIDHASSITYQQALVAVVDESVAPLMETKLDQQRVVADSSDAYFAEPARASEELSVYAEWLAVGSWFAENQEDSSEAEIMRLESLFDQYAADAPD